MSQGHLFIVYLFVEMFASWAFACWIFHLLAVCIAALVSSHLLEQLSLCIGVVRSLTYRLRLWWQFHCIKTLNRRSSWWTIYYPKASLQQSVSRSLFYESWIKRTMQNAAMQRISSKELWLSPYFSNTLWSSGKSLAEAKRTLETLWTTKRKPTHDCWVWTKA